MIEFASGCNLWFVQGSGQAIQAFNLPKVFVKGKGRSKFERPHDRKACAVGETKVLVRVSFENSKSRFLD